jgi:hypothetical protein
MILYLLNNHKQDSGTLQTLHGNPCAVAQSELLCLIVKPASGFRIVKSDMDNLNVSQRVYTSVSKQQRKVKILCVHSL